MGSGTFTPITESPPTPAPEALCFAFSRFELLVHDEYPLVSVPTIENLEDADLLPARIHFLGYWHTSEGEIPCYTAELNDAVAIAPEGTVFLGLRTLFNRGNEDLFQIAGQAVQVTDWDRTHQFCSRCGTPTQDQPHERAKVCPNCGLISYPRLSPAMIVRVQRVNSHGEREILLARNRRFPNGLFSILAGFVEPGETLEECVARG
ncbi:MAG: NADH pyrophosphatase zinc ribbon domain-containing protein [Chloroflexota bacterium]